MNHHQPNLYSKKIHNYYSALIIIFGVVRSFATIRLSYYTPCLLCRAKGVVKQCSFMYTRSVAITYSDHCKIRHRRDYGNTSNVSCSVPLEWISSLVMLWSGCIFLFSSRHILSFASYRFPIVEIYVFVIGISAFLLLMHVCDFKDSQHTLALSLSCCQVAGCFAHRHHTGYCK